MRASNPPSNPELLDALADDFVSTGYRPQTPGPDDRHQQDLRPVEPAQRVERRRPAELRPFLRPSAPGRGPARRHQRRRRHPGAVQRPPRPRFRATQLPDDGFESEFLDRLRPAEARERLRVRAVERGEPLADAPPAQLRPTSRPSSASRLRPRREPLGRSMPGARRGQGRRALSGRPLPPPDGRRADRVPAVASTWRRKGSNVGQGYEDLIRTLVNTKEFLIQPVGSSWPTR